MGNIFNRSIGLMSRTELSSLVYKINNAAFDHPGLPALKGRFGNLKPAVIPLTTFMSMWCRELANNPLVISTPLVMIMAAVPGKFRVKVTLLITFLQAMIVLLILLVKYRGKVVASTNRDLVTSSDMMVS